MKKILLIVPIVLAVAAVAFAIAHDTPQTSSVVDQNSYATSTIFASTTAYTIEVQYPVFTQAPAVFNQSIYALIQSAVDDFKNTSLENQQAECDTSGPCALTEPYDFQSDFTVVQSNTRYISVVLNYGGYLGGAHGYGQMSAFNYDVKSGKDLTLADIIHGPYPYDAVSRLSRPVLEQQLAQNLGEQVSDVQQMVENGTTPDPKNFTFTFTDDTITVYFQEYQVGPYVFGQPSIQLKRTDLDAVAQSAQ